VSPIFFTLMFSILVHRSRLCQLVCDLLIKPEFPMALIGPLLELQTKLWPQEMHR
jgi:hypothetical protein